MANEKSNLKKMMENKDNRPINNNQDIFDEQLLFGNSNKMKAIGEIIDRISDTDVSVLISGESGTGKDLMANAIYNSSLRKGKPLVKVNCVALPGGLLESELFGHEKGAFTGAYQSKPGIFELAHKGTILLDEIGDMPHSLQAKLLRVLQEGEFFRLGGKDEIKVDVRLISATNRDLEEMVRDGIFREDLYHRLNVIRIQIPSLKDRREEIPHLVNHFITKYTKEYYRKIDGISEKGLNALLNYSWPGNIRELENVIKKIVVLGDEEKVFKTIAENENREQNTDKDRFQYNENISLKEIGKRAALEAEKKIIKKILDQTRWNRSKTAKILQVSYKTLLYKIKASGLDQSM